MTRPLCSVLAALALLMTVSGCAAEDDPAICDQIDGRERCWLIELPPALAGLDADDPAEDGNPAVTPDLVPLVLDLHGFTSDAAGQRRISGIEPLAERDGLIAVWPQGLDNSWNAGELCCGESVVDDIDDVAFLAGLIDRLATELPIDRGRVYLTGWSNGCAMAQRIAAEASDMIASVACMSLYLLTDLPAGYDPVPVMTVHGDDDGIIPFGPGVYQGAAANAEAWAEANGCSPDPAGEIVRDDGGGSPMVILDHTGCEASVRLVAVRGGGHDVYTGSGTTAPTTELAWDFLLAGGR